MNPAKMSPAAGIQRGTVTITLSSASQGSTAVAFATPFAATPTVVASVQAATYGYFAVVVAKSTTGCSIGVSQRDGSALSGSIDVDWVAIP